MRALHRGPYLDILAASHDRIPSGRLFLADNSMNCAGQPSKCLAYVWNPAHFRASGNVIPDPEGLEVSVK